MSLRPKTARTYVYYVGKFLRENRGPITGDVISDYLLKIENLQTRCNYLKAFKRFFRDFLKTSLMEDFKQPTPNENPSPCPSDEAVRAVFHNLE